MYVPTDTYGFSSSLDVIHGKLHDEPWRTGIGKALPLRTYYLNFNRRGKNILKKLTLIEIRFLRISIYVCIYVCMVCIEFGTV